jgi:hypothetical protein
LPDGRNIDDQAQKMTVFEAKKRLKWANKKSSGSQTYIFFKIVLNFVLIGDEVKICRKQVFGAHALQKQYCPLYSKNGCF